MVLVKKATYKIIGKVTLTSNYIYDSSRSTYKHLRKVNWQNSGDWKHPKQTAMKTLINISAYVQKFLDLFLEDTTKEILKQKENRVSVVFKE